MEWSVIIIILAVENFLQEKFDSHFKLLFNLIEIFNAQKLLNFCEGMIILSWIKFCTLVVFQDLYLKKQVNKRSSPRHLVDVK